MNEMTETKWYFIETKLGRNFLRDAMTPGIVIRPDEAVARLNSQVDAIAALTAERDALKERVSTLEVAIDRIHTTANVHYESMRGSGKNIDFVYRIRSICRAVPPTPRPDAEPTPAPFNPDFSDYELRMIAESTKKPGSELEGRKQ